MNKTIYRQTDGRWRSLPYPGGGYYLNGSGCGCLAVTHCVMEILQYSNYTPKNTQPFMKQYAVRGDGTLRTGITAGLKHWGFKNVVRHSNMSSLWKELEKGNRVGVLLFNGNSAPNGTRWTTGGHYVAYTGYKKENGLHYLYTKDSGWRHNDKWHSYERSMRGCIVEVWSAEVPKVEGKKITYKPTSAYTGKLPSKEVKFGDKNTDVKRLQNFLNWRLKADLTKDGDFGVKTLIAVLNYKKTVGINNTQSKFGATALSKARADVKKYADKKDTTVKKKTKPKKLTKAQRINENAIKLAWKPGTSPKKYTRKTGGPCKNFRKAWKKRFPNRSINPGCDSYVKLVLKESGLGTMPTDSWPKCVSWLKKNFKSVKVNYTKKQLKPGDIRVQKKPNGHYHIWIIVSYNGKLMRAEANQLGLSSDRYSHIVKSQNLAKHQKDWLFRAK